MNTLNVAQTPGRQEIQRLKRLDERPKQPGNRTGKNARNRIENSTNKSFREIDWKKRTDWLKIILKNLTDPITNLCPPAGLPSVRGVQQSKWRTVRSPDQLRRLLSGRFSSAKNHTLKTKFTHQTATKHCHFLSILMPWEAAWHLCSYVRLLLPTALIHKPLVYLFGW